jgi:hypothetical protein
MQTPPLTYPRLPVALTHAVTLGARAGWHDLVQLSQYQPTGHQGWAQATELVVSAIIDVSAKTNTATAARRRNHCFIADPLLLAIQTFRRPRPPVNGHGNHPRLVVGRWLSAAARGGVLS